MTPIEELCAKLDRLVSKNEALFTAAIKDFRAQYLEAIQTSLTKHPNYTTFGQEPTGYVYVDSVPYVPAADYRRLRTVLEWYAEKAQATTQYTLVSNDTALEAVIVELSLDAGERARAVLGPKT